MNGDLNQDRILRNIVNRAAIHRWYEANYKLDTYVRIVMLDFRQTFYLINHHLLLEKLQLCHMPSYIIRHKWYEATGKSDTYIRVVMLDLTRRLISLIITCYYKS